MGRFRRASADTSVDVIDLNFSCTYLLFNQNGRIEFSPKCFYWDTRDEAKAVFPTEEMAGTEV